MGVTISDDLVGRLDVPGPRYTLKSLGAYEAAVASGQLPTERGLELSDDDRRRRTIITELMCNFAVDLGDDAPLFRAELAALAPLGADGLVEIDGARVRVTPLGQLFVRDVAMQFDAHLRRSERPFSRAV